MTKIEWVMNQDGTKGETWNPIAGCSKYSPGCLNCYAERMARRLKAAGLPQYQDVVDERGWTGQVALVPDALLKPLAWKKPRRVFVGSMFDFFHPSIPLAFQNQIFSVMRHCPQHTFIALTKRPEQMLLMEQVCGLPQLPNLWLGVTAENQEQANKRIPALLQIPAAVRFVSAEPMLENIWLSGLIRDPLWFGNPRDGAWGGSLLPRLDWTICGGETGSGARPIHPDWVRFLRDQCQKAGVPFFFKGWGGPHRQGWVIDGQLYSGRLLDGREWNEYPRETNAVQPT